jgi:hypothetical protein
MSIFSGPTVILSEAKDLQTRVCADPEILRFAQDDGFAGCGDDEKIRRRDLRAEKPWHELIARATGERHAPPRRKDSAAGLSSKRRSRAADADV